MKRLTFCLALLAMLIAGTVGAYRIIEVPEVGARTITMVMGGAAAVASDACDSTSDSSLLCEDFGGSTSCDGSGDEHCRNTWTASGGGTSTITWTEANAGPGCGASGGGLEVVRGNTNVVIYKSITSSNTVYILFYFKVTTLSSSTPTILQIGNGSTAYAYFRASNTGAGTFVHRNQANGLETGHTSTALSTDTWYRVEMYFNKNQESGGFQCWIDGAEKTGANTSTFDGAIDRVYISLAATDIAFGIDNVKVHTSRPTCE